MDDHDILSPDELASRVAALLELALREQIGEAISHHNRKLLSEHEAMKPLLSVSDLARTLKVSNRTVETLIAAGKLRPLWIRGVRRFHPRCRRCIPA